MEMRLSEGYASFDSEKQNEPVNPQDCFFPEEDLVYWDDQWESEQALLAALKQKGSKGRQGVCGESIVGYL